MFFPNLLATIFFPEPSNNSSVHSLQVGGLCSRGEKGLECPYLICTAARMRHEMVGWGLDMAEEMKQKEF